MRPMPDTNVENIIATVEKIISDVITVRKGPSLYVRLPAYVCV
jgi:hypothetical protein